MESKPRPNKVNFTRLQERLLITVLAKLNNGEITERALARIVGVSQPQIHNVLKGKRRLQPELADRLLEKFEINLLDLLQIEQSLVPGVPLPQDPELGSSRAISRKGPGRETRFDAALPYLAGRAGTS